MLLALAAIAAVAAGVVLLRSANDSGASDEGLVAIAVSVDGGSPALSVFAGDLQEHPLELPVGSYYIEAVNGDGTVFSLGVVQVADGDEIALAPFSGPNADGDHAAAVRSIASFMADLELARLSVLESFSGGFQTALGDEAGQPTIADLDVFGALIAEVALQEQTVMDAVALLNGELTVAQPVSFVHVGAAPRAGLLDDLSNTYLPDLWNRLRNLASGERARALDTLANTDPRDRERLFSDLPPTLKGNARNFAEWQSAIERGEHDKDAIAINNYLYVDVTGAAQASGNIPVARQAEQGRELLEAGVDLELQAYGKVPHISKMIEVTNKAREWEAYVRKFYADPDAELNQLAADQLTGAISDQIASDLRELAPNLSESVVADLAAQLARNVIAAGPQLLGAGPTANPSPAPGSGWIDDFVDDVAEQLLADGEQGIAVAVITDDLRVCLYDAVESGLERSDALLHCAETLALDPPAPSTLEPTPAPTTAPVECWSQTEARIVPCDSCDSAVGHDACTPASPSGDDLGWLEDRAVPDATDAPYADADCFEYDGQLICY